MFIVLSRMKIYLLVIAFLCISPVVISEIHYVDCGSSFEITNVKVDDCVDTPCIINRGDTINITINTINLVPDVDDMESHAYISFMGHRWELMVTPDNPCLDWGCPLRESTTRTYKGAVTFTDSLIRRPGTVTLITTYDASITRAKEVAFCISFGVELI